MPDRKSNTSLGKLVPNSPPDTYPLNSLIAILAGQNVEKFSKNPVSNVFGFFGSEYFYFWILFSIKIFLAIFILVRTRDEPMASVPAPHATLKSASRLRLFFEWLPFRFPFSLA